MKPVKKFSVSVEERWKPKRKLKRVRVVLCVVKNLILEILWLLVQTKAMLVIKMVCWFVPLVVVLVSSVCGFAFGGTGRRESKLMNRIEWPYEPQNETTKHKQESESWFHRPDCCCGKEPIFLVVAIRRNTKFVSRHEWCWSDSFETRTEVG